MQNGFVPSASYEKMDILGECLIITFCVLILQKGDVVFCHTGK